MAVPCETDGRKIFYLLPYTELVGCRDGMVHVNADHIEDAKIFTVKLEEGIRESLALPETIDVTYT